MSRVTVSDGSALNSFHVQDRGSSTAPRIENVHSSSGVCGVGPAASTGKSVVTYCPGGTRASSASSRRLPLKPRETNDIFCLLVSTFLASLKDDRPPLAASREGQLPQPVARLRARGGPFDPRGGGKQRADA